MRAQSEILDELWYSGGSSSGTQRECLCGITWFAEGDWDWEEKDLEEMRQNAKSKPDLFIETSGVSSTHLFGKEWVWDCEKCMRELLKYQTFIIENRRSIAAFLNQYLSKKASEAKREAEQLAIGQETYEPSL